MKKINVKKFKCKKVNIKRFNKEKRKKEHSETSLMAKKEEKCKYSLLQLFKLSVLLILRYGKKPIF